MYTCDGSGRKKNKRDVHMQDVLLGDKMTLKDAFIAVLVLVCVLMILLGDRS